VTIDGLSGADHVFNPYGITNGVAIWHKSGSATVGDEQLTISVTRNANGRNKWLLKLKLPKTQDVDVGGVTRPTVVRTAYMTVEVLTDGTAIDDDRGELLDMLRSLLDNNSGAGRDKITESWVFSRPFF
jgi:hypothetical protein